tara:strand:+ start:232 stop:678 length:447 start_codon:yes stop_codon:yes gene_type:complete
MIQTIKTITEQFLALLLDDPVRPTIPHLERVGENKDIFVFRDDDENVKAITCVSYQCNVPTTESELFEKCSAPTVAVFYTIWSYAPGAGRQLIFDAVEYIKENKKEITRFVTLSPKTDMARKFHTRNGAIVFRDNPETVNYEYLEVRV